MAETQWHDVNDALPGKRESDYKIRVEDEDGNESEVDASTLGNESESIHWKRWAHSIPVLPVMP